MSAGNSSFSTSELETLSVVAVVTSVLSLCGSLFACACYVAFRHKRTFGLQLVFLMSVNDVACHAWIAIQAVRVWGGASGQSHALCIAQGHLASYFELSCVLWTGAIAYTLFATVLRGHQLHEVARRLPYMALVCQSVPLVSCVVSQLYDAYGIAGAWCWIDSSTPAGGVLQFATFYIPCWLCITFNLYVYISVRLRLRALSSKSSHWAHTASDAPPAASSLSSLGRSNSRWISQTDFDDESNIFGSVTSDAEDGAYVELADASQTSQQTVPHAAGSDSDHFMPYHPQFIASQRSKFHRLRKLSRRLMVYPMILVLCWSWATVSRIRGIFKPEGKLLWLSILHIAFIMLQGLLNSIAYGLTEGTGNEILARLKRRRPRMW